MVAFFGNGLKVPTRGARWGQNRAVAPGGARHVAGIVRHRVTLSSAGHGLSAGGQLWLIYTLYV